MLNLAAKLGRAFGGLRIRYKLMVLHNLFFLVLAAAVWFAVVPLVDRTVAVNREHELELVGRMLATPGALRAGSFPESYAFDQGPAAQLGVPSEVRAQLDAVPGRAVAGPGEPLTIYARAPGESAYRRLRIPSRLYDSAFDNPRVMLLVVLGLVYCLAVLVLEFYLLRRYVYYPLRILLEADEASRQGDKERELIDAALIQNDELGQLMNSRNATVYDLRRREIDLEGAFKKLQETAADLTRKNNLLETAKRNIADQDRLASLGLLSASVAHELNTPLAVLSGSIDKLIETVPEPTAQTRLKRMLRVTRRLEKMSDSLVDFARVRSQKTEAVAVRPLIDEAWDLVTISEKADGVHFTNVTRAADWVVGNEDRLAQIFVNLLHNALQATPLGGHIQALSRRELVGESEFVFIDIVDDGPGIPADVLPEVFEAFVTTRLDSRGTGLGLTVAEGIAHQHGGAITALNRPEGGACLEVQLPSAEVPDTMPNKTADHTPEEMR